MPLIDRPSVYLWTHHAKEKMRFYRLSASRIIRIIRHPARLEEGILDNAIACMSPAGGKNYSEIWTMYMLTSSVHTPKGIKIITCWRYPGKSPARDPIPQEILNEIKSIAFS